MRRRLPRMIQPDARVNGYFYSLKNKYFFVLISTSADERINM